MIAKHRQGLRFIAQEEQSVFYVLLILFLPDATLRQSLTNWLVYEVTQLTLPHVFVI